MRKTCTGPECDLLSRSLGLCARHYQQHHAGRELTPLVGSRFRSFTLGEDIYHYDKPCRFIARVSSAYLMLAALMAKPNDNQPSDRLCETMNRAAEAAGGRRDISVVEYEDGKIGFLRSNLSREPRNRPKPSAFDDFYEKRDKMQRQDQP